MGDALTLSGLRVLDLTRSMAGPWTTRMLADAGAEVLKIEPLMGDFVRHLPASTGEFSSGYFQQANSGKRSVCVDLHTPAGIGLVNQLIPHADVVMHNMRPNAARRLNLEPARVHALNPSVVFCQISGYGADSPFVDKPGQDMAVQCMTGIAEMSGVSGGEPAIPIWSLVDTLTSAYAYSGILSALHARATRGLERIAVELSMAHCSALLHDVGPQLLARGEQIQVERSGQFHPFLTVRGVLAVADGYIAISAFRTRHWARLAALIGFGGELQSSDARRGRKAEIEARTQAFFAAMTVAESLARLEEIGVPAHEVRASLEDVQRSLVFQEREMLVRAGEALLVGGMVHKSSSAEALRGGAPALGEANLYTLHELLGLEKQAILNLLAEGIIGGEPDTLVQLVEQCSDRSAAGDVA